MTLKARTREEIEAWAYNQYASERPSNAASQIIQAAALYGAEKALEAAQQAIRDSDIKGILAVNECIRKLKAEEVIK